MRILFPILLFILVPTWSLAQTSFEQASASIQKKLEASVEELNRVREESAAVKIPLNRKLNELENDLTAAREEYQKTTRLLDSRTLDLTNLRTEIKAREEEAAYLKNLLGEYIRNFESRLHIADLQRYQEPLETAKLAAENNALTDAEVFAAQAQLAETSLDRLEDAVGGVLFSGTAIEPSGIVKPGTFVLVGPIALFRSLDGESVGIVEQKLGSLEPALLTFKTPEDAASAESVILRSKGLLPVDPTLGSAMKIEATEETLVEHIKKGGPVMYPIFALAGAALLIAMYKWLTMQFIRRPSPRRIRLLMDLIARHDIVGAREHAKKLGGPVGAMLVDGVEHLKEPRDLIEEVMYERVLATKLRLEFLLPFLAISAAAAPLLGLLGTVTGIINTFKLITVFGSGDVKMLSAGISEALITTEYGLIVAIPSLLVHSLLSRKARAIINEMEKAAVALVNQVSKTPFTSARRNESSGNGSSRHPENVDAPLSVESIDLSTELQPGPGRG